MDALLALDRRHRDVLPWSARRSAASASPEPTAVAAGGGAAALLLVPPAADVYALSLLMLAFGACFGALDVALNNAGILLEARARRPLMSACTPMYSGGGLVGALTGGALIWAGATSAQHFALLLPVALALILQLAPALPAEAPCTADSAEGLLPRRRGWSLPVALIGLFAACAAFGEGATGDWAGVYLKETVLSPSGVEALGYGAFSLTMLGGRTLRRPPLRTFRPGRRRPRRRAHRRVRRRPGRRPAPGRPGPRRLRTDGPRPLGARAVGLQRHRPGGSRTPSPRSPG